MTLSTLKERVLASTYRHDLTVNPDGSVWRGGRRVDRKHTKGYRIVEIGGIDCYAHRLIWQLLKGDIPADRHINHINGIRDDNRIENLEVVTCAQNKKHGYDIGISHARRGADIPWSRLTDADVREIVRRVDGGETMRLVAADYGVSRGTVQDIVLGKTWRHVTGREPQMPGARRGANNPTAKLTDDIVRSIRLDLRRGVPGAQLARQHGVSPKAICCINLGRTWRHVVVP